LQNLHEDFCVVDRKALKALCEVLVTNLAWQRKAVSLIRRLRSGKKN